MSYSYFALLSRMKYINRWALMRNAREENLSEHCLEVAILTHALCVIGNKKWNKNLSVEKAVLRALYHDAAEILTGDMPTPVKYRKEELKTAYKKVEKEAEERLLSTLPQYLTEEFGKVFFPEDYATLSYENKLIKAADKLSALIKCEEELRAGNQEFSTAAMSTRKKVEEMAEELPELKCFMEDFLPEYGKTLDELTEE
ncbi:5'-deoxynucleotidase [Oribacterium parvum]|uniref:5'-deoxynucleotidase n=1 Tax=Oribacterium parvum TaxID=1501329 RepID=UPI0028E310FA|nr:5'-deoxynucleotidase [Oribacterium parvum]